MNCFAYNLSTPKRSVTSFSVYDSRRLRSCRSHESLLKVSSRYSIDLNNQHEFATPVHTSMVGTSHSFRIGKHLCACQRSADCDRWIECTTKAMQPNRDVQRRQENTLQVWILEAKGMPQKRRYFCELWLDGSLYFRTTSKLKTDICFWGEQHEIKHLVKLDQIVIKLYREADRKKKRESSTLVGCIEIPAQILASKHAVEKWYVVSGGEKAAAKSETVSLRVKARYQNVTILPLKVYSGFLKYVVNNYLTLCRELECRLGVKAKEDFANSLIRILQEKQLAKDFLCELIMLEVEDLDNDHLMFRGNSLATKAMEAYIKLVGEEYLHNTLADFVQSVLSSGQDCEVDPEKVSSLVLITKHQELLMDWVRKAWSKIVDSFYEFPTELIRVFSELRQRLNNCSRGELADNLISSSIFLRFLCPAILSPSLFNLVQEYPCGKTARNLTLIAKTIQTLANFTKFGGKEHYMDFMNKFIEGESRNMRKFLDEISNPMSFNIRRHNAEWNGCIDLGKDLSLLHAYLVEVLPQADMTNAADKKLLELQKVLRPISEALCNSNYSPGCFSSDSSSPSSPLSEYDNASSPLAEKCDCPSQFALANGMSFITAAAAAADSYRSFASTRPVARHLNTDDDYVHFSAISENLNLCRAGMITQKNRQNKKPFAVTTTNDQDGNAVTALRMLSAGQIVRGNVGGDLEYVDDYPNCQSVGGTGAGASAGTGLVKGSTVNGRVTGEVRDEYSTEKFSNYGGTVSSGYYSLNNSGSMHNSSVDKTQPSSAGGDKCKPGASGIGCNSNKEHEVSLCLKQPLAIANPLYSLQSVPALPSHSHSCSSLYANGVRSYKTATEVNKTPTSVYTSKRSDCSSLEDVCSDCTVSAGVSRLKVHSNSSDFLASNSAAQTLEELQYQYTKAEFLEAEDRDQAWPTKCIDEHAACKEHVEPISSRLKMAEEIIKEYQKCNLKAQLVIEEQRRQLQDSKAFEASSPVVTAAVASTPVDHRGDKLSPTGHHLVGRPINKLETNFPVDEDLDRSFSGTSSPVMMVRNGSFSARSSSGSSYKTSVSNCDHVTPISTPPSSFRLSAFHNVEPERLSSVAGVKVNPDNCDFESCPSSLERCTLKATQC